MRGEYEKRLGAMTNELRELMSTGKQHIMAIRSQQTDKTQLDLLQRQLADMIKLKVCAI